MTEMVTVTIEGTEVTVPKGTRVIEAAKQAGVLIPHYCYHPSLPAPGLCRMCLVDIEGAPKLQIACATTVSEGQVVRVTAPEARKARQSVLEFYLINHPLDCPICDQAGECELQDFVFQEGRPRTRYTPTYPKRFNPVEDFGPDIVYVPNRCILCTRCTRFMDTLAQDSILNVSERGDRAVIGIHPDRQLDHAWAGNVVDLCPVGSLLSKDFLHKARAWETDKAASICTGCSQGCNVNLDTRTNVVVRARPRTNLEVNQYFMCDHGRLNYRWMNRGDRMEVPLVKNHGELVASDWDEGLTRAAELVRGAEGKAVALVSPHASTEALFLVKRLLAGFTLTGGFRVERVEGEYPLPGVPNLALREERAPNVKGAELLGFREAWEETLAAVKDAAIVVVLQEHLGDLPAGAMDGAGKVLVLSTVVTEAARAADVALPIANVAEEDGTFVNRDARVQRYFQAKAAPGMARPAWWVLGEMVTDVTGGEPLDSAAEAFDRMATAEAAFGGLSYRTLGYGGVVVVDAAGVSA